jgi:anti-anti-sigma factor
VAPVTNATRPRWLHAVDAAPVIEALRPDDRRQVVITRRGRRVVVRGELDFSGVSALAEALDRIRADHAAAVVVDLAASTFIDSSVVATLLRADERLRALACELVVVASPGDVRRTLELTGACATLRVLAKDDGPFRVRRAPALRLLRGGSQQV